MLGPGDTAPSFDLEDVHGVPVSLASLLQGGAALLVVYKISCPVCQYTLPYLDRISKSVNVRIVGVSQDDRDDTLEFAKEFGLTFPSVLDRKERGYALSNGLGVTHVPSMFLVQPDGEISMSWAGWSRRDMEGLGTLAGVQPFEPGEKVPEWRGG